MFRGLISAFLVLRLEIRHLPIDLELVLAQWRQRSAIEIAIGDRQTCPDRRAALRRKLDEVYPF